MAENTPPNTDPNQNPNPNPNPAPPSDADKEKERILNENAQLRKQLKDSDTKLTQFSEELSNLKKAGHKNSGDWQKLAETHEQEAKSYKEKFENASKAFVNTLTSSKVREEALKQGFKQDLVDLLDNMELDGVEAVIDENNRFNVKGVETAVGNLKKLRPSLFTEAAPPKFNAGGANAPHNPGPTTVKDAQAAYLEARKNRFKDPVTYQKALETFSKAALESRKAKK